MEKLDKDLQNRVWQRVQSREKLEMPPLGQENLRPLILSLQENRQVYQNLSHQMPGKDGERIRRLQQECQKCITCMKGICCIRGEPVQVPQLNMGKEQPKRALMKCYHRERRLCADLDRMSADPEYGTVYSALSRQAKERCVAVLELLGELEKQ